MSVSLRRVHGMWQRRFRRTPGAVCSLALHLVCGPTDYGYQSCRSSPGVAHGVPWQRFRLPRLWTYFVDTVGGASCSMIKRYVENQMSR
jgi:REP element-mobilizing transposase RayT